MAVNKVVYDGNTLVDLTEDTVTPQTLRSGATAHNAAGQQITGTASAGGGSYYGTSSTGGSTAAKVVTTVNEDFELATGASIIVKFANADTAGAITLNVDSTGAKAVYKDGAAIGANVIKADIYEFVYTGTYFELVASGAGHADALIYENAFANGGDNAKESLDAIWNRLYGLCTKTTTIATVSGNKQITETGDGVTAVTTIVKTSSTVTTITAVITPSDGDYYYTKTTTITATAGGKTISESYTQTAKA